MKKSLPILLILAIFPMLAKATPQSDALFSKGNTAYVAASNAPSSGAAKASYREAAESYKAAIDAGDVSWAAYFNLGNASFKLGDYGSAVLNYERAFAIDPVKPETEINMARAREAAGLATARPTGRIEKWGTRFPMRALMWVGAIGGWAFLAAFVLPFLYGRHKMATIAASIASFALFAACMTGMYAWHIHAKWRVVTGSDAAMLAAPDEKASVVRKLSPATEVNVIRTYDKWIFVRAEQGDEGWVLSEKASSVWTD
jgi:hypothetical protein